MGAGCTIPISSAGVRNISMQVSTPKKSKKENITNLNILNFSPDSIDSKKIDCFDFIDEKKQKFFGIGKYLFSPNPSQDHDNQIWKSMHEMESPRKGLFKFYKKHPGKFIKYLLNGPGQEYRWLAWNVVLSDFYQEGVYEELLEQSSSFENDILKDIFRTFPQHLYFKEKTLNDMDEEKNHKDIYFYEGSPEKKIETKRNDYNKIEDNNELESSPLKKVEDDFNIDVEVNTLQTLSDKFGNQPLFRILKAIAIMFPTIGYCQGMNFIAGFLLLVSGGQEIETFWMFVNLIRNSDFQMSGFYENGFPLLKLYSHMFFKLLEKRNKKLFIHLKNADLPESVWLTKWLLTGFVYTNPLEIAVRFWDYIVASKSLFSMINISLGVSKIFELSILEKDTMEIADMFRNINENNRILLDKHSPLYIDVNKFIKRLKKIKLSKKKIGIFAKEYLKIFQEEESNNKYAKFYRQYGYQNGKTTTNLKKKKTKTKFVNKNPEILSPSNSLKEL